MDYSSHLNNLSYTVYKVTCRVNDKIYIGITNSSGAERWRRHVSEAFAGGVKNKFKNALRKYGSDEFVVEEIDWCQGFDAACELEKQWIAHYNSYETGYNGTKGGQGVPGCFWKDNVERVKAQSKRMKEYFAANPQVGRLAPEEQKKRMSESHLRLAKNPVIVLGVEYNSIRAAAKALNTSFYKVNRYLEDGIDDFSTRELVKKPYVVGTRTFESRQAAADFLKVNVHNLSWKIRTLTRLRVLEEVMDKLESGSM
jgi:group I intron endonuclease